MVLAGRPVREGRQDFSFQRDDVSGVPQRLTGAARRPAVAGDHSPAGGSDVEVVLTEPVTGP
jgi:hypothetical protein